MKGGSGSPPDHHAFSPPPIIPGQRRAGKEQVAIEPLRRKPGRPKAIPKELMPRVLELYYQEGLGYRAITRELRKLGIYVHWTTVRRLLKADKEPGCHRE